MGTQLTTPEQALKDAGQTAERITKDVGNFVMDGVDSVKTTVDGARVDVFSTTRQLGSDAAAIIDSTLDNLNTTVNQVSVAFFDTIQIISILVFAGVLLFLLFYGDKIFMNGIRLGRINLI